MNTLIATWTAKATQMREDAEALRSNGMYESARGLRLKADQLTDCAAELQRAITAAETTDGEDCNPRGKALIEATCSLLDAAVDTLNDLRERLETLTNGEVPDAADEATREAVECAELRAALAAKSQAFLASHQEAQALSLQTAAKIQREADAAAMAEAAALVAASPQAAHASPPPMPNAGGLAAHPGPAHPADNSAAATTPAPAPHTDHAPAAHAVAPTALDAEATPGTPSPTSSPKSHTSAGGDIHSSADGSHAATDASAL